MNSEVSRTSILAPDLATAKLVIAGCFMQQNPGKPLSMAQVWDIDAQDAKPFSTPQNTKMLQ